MSLAGFNCCCSPSCQIVGINASLWVVGFPILYYDPSTMPYRYPITRRFLRKTLSFSANCGGTVYGYLGVLTVDRYTGVVTIAESGTLLAAGGFDFIWQIGNTGPGGSTNTVFSDTSITWSNADFPSFPGATAVTGSLTLDEEYTQTMMQDDINSLLAYLDWPTATTDGNSGLHACTGGGSTIATCQPSSCAVNLFWNSASFFPSAFFQAHVGDPQLFFTTQYPYFNYSGNYHIDNPFATFIQPTGVQVAYEGNGIPIYGPNLYAVFQGSGADFAWDSYMSWFNGFAFIPIAAAYVYGSSVQIVAGGNYCEASEVDVFSADAPNDATGPSTFSASNATLAASAIINAPNLSFTGYYQWTNTTVTFHLGSIASGSTCP